MVGYAGGGLEMVERERDPARQEECFGEPLGRGAGENIRLEGSLGRMGRKGKGEGLRS